MLLQYYFGQVLSRVLADWQGGIGGGRPSGYTNYVHFAIFSDQRVAKNTDSLNYVSFSLTYHCCQGQFTYVFASEYLFWFLYHLAAECIRFF